MAALGHSGVRVSAVVNSLGDRPMIDPFAVGEFDDAPDCVDHAVDVLDVVPTSSCGMQK